MKSNNAICWISVLSVYQVNLDEAALSKVVTDEGLISKADFIKLGQDLKLLEFGGPMGEKRKLATPRKERKLEHEENVKNIVMNSLDDLLVFHVSCLSWIIFIGFVVVASIQGRSNHQRLSTFFIATPLLRLQSPADEDASRELKRDRVLTAFTTWDLDGDGYLSWDEFQRIRSASQKR